MVPNQFISSPVSNHCCNVTIVMLCQHSIMVNLPSFEGIGVEASLVAPLFFMLFPAASHVMHTCNGQYVHEPALSGSPATLLW